MAEARRFFRTDTSDTPDNTLEGGLCCASCGIAKVDEVQLSKCPACDLVQYCSIECQREHKPQHKQACEKRAAELREEILFKHPEGSHLGDCPIYLLPLPLDCRKSRIMSCCYTKVCNGCAYANDIRELKESLEHTCPFCRRPFPRSGAAANMNVMKRVKVNDPAAIRGKGIQCYEQGDYVSAFAYLTRAAEAVDESMYSKGKCVEKDTIKAVYHWEQTAIRGHPISRYNLAILDMFNGRLKRATKHWLISACIGLDPSLERLKFGGYVEKDDFATALRGHHAAKSPQREAADAAKLDD
eukprot:scaffold448_cov81-Skeletonema_dohrnii-CCMP3373.AAC.2